jgi:ABC-type Zn uptake system ZnuABC Zn-binding protein ZnuA
VGNFGNDGLVRIDADTQATTLLPLPGLQAAFKLAPEDGGRIVVVTMAGQLLIVDPMTGAILGSVDVATAVPADAPRGTPRPGLAVDSGLAFVSDPAAGSLRMIDLDDLTVVTEVVVGGAPTSMALVGFPTEHGAHEHDHAEDAAAKDDAGKESTEEHESHDEHEEHAHHHHDGDDPHTWQSVPRVMMWVDNVAAALSARDPANAAAYADAAAAYRAELAALDEELRAQLATLPEERRKLVSDHGNLGYFAAEYGFTVIGTVIPSLSTAAAASAQELAVLQDQITAEGVPAIFVGSTVNPRLADQLAQDLGVQVVPIYTDSLSDANGPAATYVDMMRSNVAAIIAALQ